MYQFKIKWWYDNEETTTCGIVAGNSYGDAVSTLISQFGEEETVEIQLTNISDSYVLCYKEGVTDLTDYFDSF